MAITNGYTTLPLLKIELNINDSNNDSSLELAIGAASRQIDNYTGLVHGFWQDGAVTTREFYSDGSYGVYIPEGISTSTGLVVKIDPSDNGTWSTTLAGTDFQLAPINAADASPVQPWTRLDLYGNGPAFTPSGFGRPNVQITAKFGWPAIPDDVAKACLIQSTLLYKASDAALGAIVFDGFATRMGKGLHPVAESLLEGFCLPRVG